VRPTVTALKDYELAVNVEQVVFSNIGYFFFFVILTIPVTVYRFCTT